MCSNIIQKVVHGKAPQYLKDLLIPSERLHVAFAQNKD